MELDIRDWMIVIGVLLFLAVVLDGYRRAQRERRHRVKLARGAGKVRFSQADPDGLSELPNGGNKRVVESQVVANHVVEDDIAESDVVENHDAPNFEKPKDTKVGQIKVEPISADYGIDDENDPLFSNPFEKLYAEPKANVLGEDALVAESFVAHTAVKQEAAAKTEEKPEQKPAPTIDLKASQKAEAAAKAKAQAEFARNQQVTLPVFDDEIVSKPVKQAPLEEPEEILVIHVMASDKEEFQGEELLSILLGCDCRFGAMNIFHRYESANGKGLVQFSVVNRVEPGIFVLDSIQEFTTPGVSLFMRLPGPKEALAAYEAMVGVAQCIAKNLNGTLYDEFDSTMTEQTLEHGRQRIRDYLQRRLRNHV